MKKLLFMTVLTVFTTLTISCSKDDSVETTITASDFTANVDENSNNGTSLGTVNATTNTGNLTFSITSQTPNDAIAINSSTGEITIANKDAFDYETNTEIKATIKVTNGETTKTINATILINDVNTVNELFKDNEIVAYYPFNGNANDESTNTYNGTVNNTTLVKDRNNKENAAYNFDNDATIDFSENIPLGKNSFSISFWVKLPSTLANGSYVILSKREACSIGNLIQVNYNPSTKRINTGLRSDNTQNNFTAGTGHTFTTHPTDWFHVTIVKNNANKNVSMYINGTTNANSTSLWTSAANDRLLDITNNAKFSLGNSPCVNVDGSKYFEGSIDDVLIVNRVLTNAEITELAK